MLIRHHCRTEQHRRVLSCLLECRTNKGVVSVPPSTSVTANFVRLCKII